MKNTADILQALLSQPGFFAGLLGCVVVVLIVAQSLKFGRCAIFLILRGIGIARKAFLRLSIKTGLFYVFCGLAIFLFRPQVVDAIQYAERNWLSPTYLLPQDTSAWALSRYEAELDRHVSPEQSELIRRRTREIAARIGCPPRAIYEVAFSECGLNPFAVNINRATGDTLAAGWIQFTRAGVKGLTINGRPATFADAKAACVRRDAGLMMDLTEQYLVRAAAGRPLPNSTEVYTAIFAPYFIGAPESQVLYSGHENPAYYLNSVLDGRRFSSKKMADGSEKILWSRKPDGAITKQDLRLHLAWKCAKFLN